MTVVDVVQIGAREHYAVPLMLWQQGVLRYLHTDLYAGRDTALGRIADLAAMLCPTPSVERLLGRRADLPRFVVKSNSVLGVRARLQQRQAESVFEQTVAFHDFQKAICQAALNKGRPLPDIFVGFRGSDSLFEAVKGRSCCVLDQIDGAINEVAIIAREQEIYSNWLPSHSRANVVSGRTRSWLGLEAPRLEREWALADLIVCNSNWSKHCLMESGVPGDKCIVVPLAYEPRKSFHIELDGTAPRDGPLVVAFLGTLTLRKGIHILLEAIKQARTDEPILLKMAGSLDIDPKMLHQYASFATYEGNIPREAVPSFLRSAHVLALPSISEGFGIVQLEAMSCGIPVITSDRTGEVVRDGIDGRVVPAGDTSALARILVNLASDRDLVAEMGQNARSRVSDFSLDSVGGKWILALEAAMNRAKLSIS